MAAPDVVGDFHARVATRFLRERTTFLEILKELARSPARRHDVVVRVEDDDHLAALLDEDPAPGGLESEVLRLGTGVLTPKQSFHDFFTTPTPASAA
jgi:hypothetical protein